MIFLSQIGDTLRKTTSPDYDTVTLTLSTSEEAVVTGYASVVVDGYHEFFGIKEVVRAYMLANNLSVITLTGSYTKMLGSTTTTESFSASVSVLFDGAKLIGPIGYSADVAVDNYFLTHYKVGWVCRDCKWRLYYFSTNVPPATVTYTKKDGTSVSSDLSTSFGLSYFDILYNEDYVQAHVVMGNRTFDIYFIDKPADEQLAFRNVFNVEEYISFPAATTIHPTTEFDTARLENISIPYDIEHELEIKIKTGPLPPFMYPALIDMCRSRSVKRVSTLTLGGTSVSREDAMIVTEYDFDQSNEPNTPIALELTLQYADRRMNDAVIVR